MKHIEITAESFRDNHLISYYDLTINGPYNMMDNDKWIRLKEETISAIINGEPIVITYDEILANIEVSIMRQKFYFKSNAKTSFGTYLYRTFFEKEEKQVAISGPGINSAYEICGQNASITTSELQSLANSLKDYNCYTTTTNSDVIINGNLTVNGKIIENNKEEIDMNMKKFGLDFGRAKNVKMSMYGLAVKGANGSYVAYDKNKNVIVDVDIFNFDAEQYTFKIPVPISSLKVGDLIVHNGKMMYVQDTEEAYDNAIAAIDIAAGEDKLIRLTRNMFGFEYATKVVSLFDSMGNTPTSDNPFGNMWMLALADGGSMDTSTLAMMMLMNGQPQTAESGFNPMMLLLLDKDNSNDNLLPLMMMMNMKQ